MPPAFAGAGFAAAPLSPSGSGLFPSLRWGRLLAQRFSPSRRPREADPTMASADPSSTIGCRRRHPTPVARRAGEVSHGKTLHFLGSAAGSTRACDGRSIGRPRLLPGCPTALAPGLRRGRLCIRCLFVGPPICLRLPPHPASLRRSCPLPAQGQAFGYRFRSLRPEEDFHLQVQCHAWHTIDPRLRPDHYP